MFYLSCWGCILDNQNNKPRGRSKAGQLWWSSCCFAWIWWNFDCRTIKANIWRDSGWVMFQQDTILYDLYLGGQWTCGHWWPLRIFRTDVGDNQRFWDFLTVNQTVFSFPFSTLAEYASQNLFWLYQRGNHRYTALVQCHWRTLYDFSLLFWTPFVDTSLTLSSYFFYLHLFLFQIFELHYSHVQVSL